MSYEIIYDKQFIKLSNDRFIPIVLGGSNNCTELSPKGRERRARDWNNVYVGESRISTLEQMLTHSNELKERLIDSNNKSKYKTDEFDNYNDSRFGWFAGLQIGSGGTSRTTFKMYENLFIYGCKNALSVEELVENGVNVHVFSSYYSNEKLKEKGMEPFSKYFSTTSELEDFIIEKEKLFKDNNLEAAFYISYSMSESTLSWLRKKKKLENVNVKNKTLTEISEAYVIKIDGGYFHNRTKKGFSYSFSTPKYWYTEKAVKRVMNTLKKDAHVMKFNPFSVLEKLSSKRNVLI